MLWTTKYSFPVSSSQGKNSFFYTNLFNYNNTLMARKLIVREEEKTTCTSKINRPFTRVIFPHPILLKI